MTRRTLRLAAPVPSILGDIIAFGLVALAILAPFVVAAGFILFALVTGKFLKKRLSGNPGPAVTA